MPILVISNDQQKSRVLTVLETGIHGYVTGECCEDEISRAVVAVAKGEKFFCNKIIDVLLEKKISNGEEPDCEPTILTEREIEISTLLAEGLNGKTVADKLCISHHTVHTHRKNIMKKLKIKTAYELTIYAINTGLIKVEAN